MLIDKFITKVLHIDLSNKHFWIENRKDLFEKYIGGTGVATQLLIEECPENCDPFSQDNPIIFAIGPLTGLFPLASKTVAMFKSPHTGDLGESHCGGRSAVAIQMAGFGAIVIKGNSEIPIYLVIEGDKVHFRDASTLWGMRNSFTVSRIIREKEKGAGFRTIMRIGRAGENLVSYACVTTESYRHFGRLGLGAVFGSKKLKAIVVSGKRSVPIRDKKGYRKLYDQIYDTVVSSSAMQKYHDLGTAQNIIPLNQLGGLPTKNLQATQFKDAEKISGEAFAENYLGRRLACSHCPVACIHIAALREPYEDESYFYKTSMIGYDYEPIYAIGSMLGISDPQGFLKLMDQIEILGMDVMSTGVILAWATEMFEKKNITSNETNDVTLKWGDYKAFINVVKNIVTQPNDFYRALAKGVTYAADKYGGKEFALSFAKNEMPGYHTGPAAHLGVLMGARHSHLDNAGYSIDQKELLNREMSAEELVNAISSEEQWRQILSSLVVCFFARGIYKPELVLDTLNIAGLEVTKDDLSRIGREIHHEKFKFKFREGFSFEKLSIPDRITETESPVGKINKKLLYDSINHFNLTLKEQIKED